ncbi:unnamed protein product [Fraxinus pennsylvanica]|uniref:Protein FAR1-RELATED SEQUENCE n=1 Tax=Fraxinus pennsylvanica TaxID=56036 RepID=A0AAD1Z1P4_9LAMI|nr:unnamed protein product [Fraxinus pennsylvanica]
MENAVLEFDIGLGGADDDIDIEPRDDEDDDEASNVGGGVGSGSGDNAYPMQIYFPEGDLDLEPYEGMEFESEEAAKAFYNSHVLAVFRVTNVLTLPSHYILKRWTRNAKSSLILEERVTDLFNGYLESHTVRYNTLRHEAFKFVDEGAETLESYNVAMAALLEASKKVSLATKNEGKTSTSNGRMRDVSTGDETNRESQGSSAQRLSEDDMDQKICELSQELERANRKCEVYHTNLLSILKDVEDHKQQLSVKVQTIKLTMKDNCSLSEAWLICYQKYYYLLRTYYCTVRSLFLKGEILMYAGTGVAGHYFSL